MPTDPGPLAPEPLPPEPLPAEFPAGLQRWIRTECGRAKYQDLATRSGAWARLRLGVFVLIAALRDLGLPEPATGAGAEAGERGDPEEDGHGRDPDR